MIQFSVLFLKKKTHFSDEVRHGAQKNRNSIYEMGEFFIAAIRVIYSMNILSFLFFSLNTHEEREKTTSFHHKWKSAGCLNCRNLRRFTIFIEIVQREPPPPRPNHHLHHTYRLSCSRGSYWLLVLWEKHLCSVRVHSHLWFIKREFLHALLSPRDCEGWIHSLLLNFPVHTSWPNSKLWMDLETKSNFAALNLSRNWISNNGFGLNSEALFTGQWPGFGPHTIGLWNCLATG